eukprot:c44066_g1_i1 orf=2-169(-)
MHLKKGYNMLIRLRIECQKMPCLVYTHLLYVSILCLPFELNYNVSMHYFQIRILLS